MRLASMCKQIAFQERSDFLICLLLARISAPLICTVRSALKSAAGVRAFLLPLQVEKNKQLKAALHGGSRGGSQLQNDILAAGLASCKDALLAQQ